MALFKTFLVLGLATVSPFSIAQEIIQRGNQKFPHQPPSWFVALASPSRQAVEPLDSFIAAKQPTSPKPSARISSGIKYPCVRGQEGEKPQWQFCDM